MKAVQYTELLFQPGLLTFEFLRGKLWQRADIPDLLSAPDELCIPAEERDTGVSLISKLCLCDLFFQSCPCNIFCFRKMFVKAIGNPGTCLTLILRGQTQRNITSPAMMTMCFFITVVFILTFIWGATKRNPCLFQEMLYLPCTRGWVTLLFLSHKGQNLMSDSSIIDLIKNGGQPALGKVYATYRSEFISWMMKAYPISEDDCKDIYQVTILIFYDNVRSGRLTHMVSSIKTYLFGIGKNLARENMRKAKRITSIDQKEWLREHLVEEDQEPFNDNVFSIAREAVSRLGDPCRKLVELYYYQKKSMQEISNLLNYKNADTAKNQKCKCMAKLRKLYEELERTAQTSTTL